MIQLHQDFLLNWMSNHSLPLELFREDDTQMWVVADASGGGVIGSGEDARDALLEAYKKSA